MPVIIIANKADNEKRALESYALMELGLGEVIPVSPMQSRGFRTLCDAMTRELRTLGFDTKAHTELDNPDILKLAIIGRPNVGKSSLVNAIS